MMDEKKDSAVSFYPLDWDTQYFGITCAKAILHKPLDRNNWCNLKEKMQAYQFVSIENRNSEPVNTHFIGTETSAFLADVNIQFIKKPDPQSTISEHIVIQNDLNKNEDILKLSDFKVSKFVEDPGLAQRKGADVYHQWLLNAFNKAHKFFVLSKNEEGQVEGYLLHSYSGDECVIELIAVSSETAQKGIGTSLFKAVEYSAKEKGCKQIRVGTQLRNISAINFYHKVGCKQEASHQVYHLWNLQD